MKALNGCGGGGASSIWGGRNIAQLFSDVVVKRDNKIRRVYDLGFPYLGLVSALRCLRIIVNHSQTNKKGPVKTISWKLTWLLDPKTWPRPYTRSYLGR